MKLTKSLHVLTGILVASIIGCSGVPVSTSDELAARAEAASNPGYVVTSMGKILKGENRGVFANNVFFFRPVGGGDGARFSYSHEAGLTKTPIDVNQVDKRARVALLKVPPGEYAITAVLFWAGGNSWENDAEFSVNFAVRPGEMVYLGEFLAAAAWGKNMLGIKVPEILYFLVNDEMERDRKILETRHTSLPWATLRKAELDLTQQNTLGFLRPGTLE